MYFFLYLADHHQGGRIMLQWLAFLLIAIIMNHQHALPCQEKDVLSPNWSWYCYLMDITFNLCATIFCSHCTRVTYLHLDSLIMLYCSEVLLFSETFLLNNFVTIRGFRFSNDQFISSKSPSWLITVNDLRIQF